MTDQDPEDTTDRAQCEYGKMMKEIHPLRDRQLHEVFPVLSVFTSGPMSKKEMQDRLEEAESLSSVEEGVEAIIAASDGRRQHAPPAPPPGRLPRRRIRPHPTEPPGDARRVE